MKTKYLDTIYHKQDEVSLPIWNISDPTCISVLGRGTPEEPVLTDVDIGCVVAIVSVIPKPIHKQYTVYWKRKHWHYLTN